MTHVLTVANQKGGTGKTTTTVNLSVCLAEAGLRVLVVDSDPQANTTLCLGLDYLSLELSLYDVLIEDVPLAEVLSPTPHGVTLAPATLTLATAEMLLFAVMSREHVLAEADYHVWRGMNDSYVTKEQAREQLTARSRLWAVDERFYWTPWPETQPYFLRTCSRDRLYRDIFTFFYQHLTFLSVIKFIEDESVLNGSL